MRAKVLIIVAVGALAILAPALYIRFKPDAPPPAPVEQAAVDNNGAAPAGGVPQILKRVTQTHPQEGLLSRQEQAEPEDHDVYVLHRRAELSELGMHNDPESLKTILSEMENPDPEIRKAALNATLDFGSKDAIPLLQNELNWATDAQEKVDIQKAIDFLQLPALGTDDTAQQSSGAAAPITN